MEWLAAHGQPMVAGERSGAEHIPLRYFSGKDAGMYDALNKGFDSASGEVVAWLNCDEQYLEGTLALVADRFRKEPGLDMLFGGALLVRPDGSLLAARKSYPARYAQIATSHLYNLSCAMFFRRRLWDAGLRFSTELRMLGDHHLVMQALKGGARTGIVKKPLSVFAFTGANLSWTDKAKQEAVMLEASAPRWIRMLKVPFNLLRLAEKAFHGGYHHAPVDYAIYEKADDPSRKRFHVDKVSVKWPEEK